VANPQPDKYTKISTELLEQLCKIRIPGEAMQVFLAILRKTYGYQKKEDRISLGQFVTLTGSKRPNIIRSINKLLSMNLIIKRDNAVYLLNKNYDLWKPLSKQIKPKKLLSKQIRKVIKRDNASLSQQIHTIDNTTIDNIYREPSSLHGKIVLIYKLLKGHKKEDREWDDANFSRNCRPAQKLAKFLNKDLERIKRCMLDLKEKYEKRGTEWSLETMMRDSLDWKKGEEG